MGRPARLAASAALAATVVNAALRGPQPQIGAWRTLNYRGRPVSLSGGLAASLGALAGSMRSGDRPSRHKPSAHKPSAHKPGAHKPSHHKPGDGAPGGATLRASALLAGLTALAAGAYDDLVAPGREAPSDKGFAGHLAALRSGRVSGGAVKIVLVGFGALASSSCLASRTGHARRADEVLLGAVVIAGAANVINLLDLRPGRALKLLVIASTFGLAGTGDTAMSAALLGASAAVLPAELSERVMLGDLGANCLGALLGVRVTTGATRTKLAAAALIVTLTLLSERVSFSSVIDRTPALRWADQLGRTAQPTAAPVVAAASAASAVGRSASGE
jgi:UDP-N-acetylmuramyl pentapeptide phosphotransferase/UDP-N-acetylglucosamine-1-phosphate transferase